MEISLISSALYKALIGGLAAIFVALIFYGIPFVYFLIKALIQKKKTEKNNSKTDTDSI